MFNRRLGYTLNGVRQKLETHKSIRSMVYMVGQGNLMEIKVTDKYCIHNAKFSFE